MGQGPARRRSRRGPAVPGSRQRGRSRWRRGRGRRRALAREPRRTVGRGGGAAFPGGSGRDRNRGRAAGCPGRAGRAPRRPAARAAPGRRRYAGRVHAAASARGAAAHRLARQGSRGHPAHLRSVRSRRSAGIAGRRRGSRTAAGSAGHAPFLLADGGVLRHVRVLLHGVAWPARLGLLLGRRSGHPVAGSPVHALRPGLSRAYAGLAPPPRGVGAPGHLCTCGRPRPRAGGGGAGPGGRRRLRGDGRAGLAPGAPLPGDLHARRIRDDGRRAPARPIEHVAATASLDRVRGPRSAVSRSHSATWCRGRSVSSRRPVGRCPSA